MLSLNREKRVRVPAGSVLFYDHNILHRASYSASPERGLFQKGSALMVATLHGCMSSAKHAGRERARVILQHDLEWVKTMPLTNGSRAAQMRDRLVSMAATVDESKLGYSLEG